MRLTLSIASLIAFLIGCAGTGVSVSVVTDISSIDNPVKQGERFFTLNLSEISSTGTINGLIEKEFLEFIAEDLELKGYNRVQELDSSDFIVTILWNTTTAKTDGYTQSLVLPASNSSTTYGSGYVGGEYVTGSSQTTSFTTKTYQYYVPPVTYHPETFVMSFLGTKDYINRKTLERYHSESKHNSDELNVLKWAPEHFQKMLEVFQKIPSDKTGYLGIAFNTASSQPIVYHIDPNGPACQWAYYLTGKKVVKINDLNIKFRTQVQRFIKKSKPGSEIILTVENNNGSLETYKIIAKSIPLGYQTNLPYF